MSRSSENENRMRKSTSGPPLRALSMVLISLGILFAGLGFASLGSDSEESAAAPTTAATETSSAPAAAATTPAPASAPAAGVPAGAAATTTPAPTTSAALPTSPPVAAGSAAGSTAASSPVRVYNNSEVSGLAASTAELLEDEGFTISETGNYSEGLLSATGVYYGTGTGEQATAEAVADALGVTAQPRFDGIVDSAPGVIVIVTSR